MFRCSGTIKTRIILEGLLSENPIKAGAQWRLLFKRFLRNRRYMLKPKARIYTRDRVVWVECYSAQAPYLEAVLREAGFQ